MTLVVFSLGMAVLAWLAAHRALKPVRELEQGLARIGRGEARVSLPPFQLKEFASIAGATIIDAARDRTDRSLRVQ